MRPYQMEPSFFYVRKMRIVHGTEPKYPDLAKLVFEGDAGETMELNIWGVSGSPIEVEVVDMRPSRPKDPEGEA